MIAAAIVLLALENCLVAPNVIRGAIYARRAGFFAVLIYLERDPANVIADVGFSTSATMPGTASLVRQAGGGEPRHIWLALTTQAQPPKIDTPTYANTKPWAGRHLVWSAPRLPGDGPGVEADLADLFDGLDPEAWRLTPATDVRYVRLSLPSPPYERHLRWAMVLLWLAMPVIVLFAFVGGLAPPSLATVAALALAALLAAAAGGGAWLLARAGGRGRAN